MGLVIHHISSTSEARRIVGEYVAALPSGSYLVMSHASNPRDGSRLADLAEKLEAKFKDSFHSLHFRQSEEIRSFFDGLELIDPGIVPIGAWWPSGPSLGVPSDVGQLCLGGVGRKP
ncbi:hypothetical protein GCM10009765_55590 [Fodinicola feengrottensis]|uniref:Uncharacterized protein n=2 Tax=Fodinicola feengrottensis TaxID=435914 RepID=A0ABN2I5W2_9ACTN